MINPYREQTIKNTLFALYYIKRELKKNIFIDILFDDNKFYVNVEEFRYNVDIELLKALCIENNISFREKEKSSIKNF